MENLTSNRKKIDQIDKKIIKFLAKRMVVSAKIGKIKKNHKLKIKDAARENKMMGNIVLLAKTEGLSAKFTRKIFGYIFLQSRKEQNG